MTPKVLVVRSAENRSLMADLRRVYPGIHWLDGPMPFLPGRGESATDRPALLATLEHLYQSAGAFDAIVYARAYGAFTPQSRAQLAAHAPAPLRTAPGAVLQALSENQTRRVFVVTPYGQARHDYELAWLREEGLTVVASACLGHDSGDAIGQMSAATVAHGIALAEALVPHVQAVYLACTVLRTLTMPFGANLPIVTATGSLVAQIRRVVGACA